jgi:SAM-dependent methyltransferase
MSDENPFVQQDQPAGVPPLVLTGERTLPDVPAENYWYRRHEAVYEWVAERVMGRRVVDLACGEGYGTKVLARTARSVVGVDANPEAFEHARAKYTSRSTRFERGLIDTWEGDVDCVVFLQTIEHVQDPDATLAHVRELIGSAGIAFISTPNLLTLAPKGAEKSENPWHIREYRADEFRELCERTFDHVDLYGVFHARKLALHALALKLGWDRLHRALRITKPFYERFTPAIAARDFQLRLGDDHALERALDFVAVCRP